MQKDTSKEQENKLKSLSEKVSEPKIKVAINEKIKTINIPINK